MKKLILVLSLMAGAFTINAQSKFGEEITEEGAISTAELLKKANDNEQITAKVSGVVESVCQAKGCWMKVKLDDGQTMRVTFKDYGFFVPKDIAGKTVVIDGTAKVKTTSVIDLKHYAEDAGKSKNEIAKIKKPEKALGFVATGVIVK
ncbi:DUF4920 domain-containing protein [Arcicella aquatica]|uniref:DUF4920 domain-containing protein n=1 Tax=Arcicella aquatica TaxID=217141 RepID=A0ABU5QNJ1_9BACT|nr:DUF4920 domain-containing protein [Arcicella aquatica]MEA5258637.1 DUF4920 domain-containing protein [Arcicella aquatica]